MEGPALAALSESRASISSSVRLEAFLASSVFLVCIMASIDRAQVTTWNMLHHIVPRDQTLNIMEE